MNRPRSAFSLIEVTIALGVVVVGLLAVLALLPVAFDTGLEASEETVAIGVLDEVLTDLLLASESGLASPGLGIELPAEGASTTWTGYLTGGAEIAGQTEARYRILLELAAPSTTALGPTTVFARASWPAQAPEDRPRGSVEFVASLPGR